ncbi:MAG: hypothetical protein U5K84_07550 [Alkalibacterium sp.]|nr:hypothetical protein [Alkalibacterium sp.]
MEKFHIAETLRIVLPVQVNVQQHIQNADSASILSKGPFAKQKRAFLYARK